MPEARNIECVARAVSCTSREDSTHEENRSVWNCTRPCACGGGNIHTLDRNGPACGSDVADDARRVTGSGGERWLDSGSRRPWRRWSRWRSWRLPWRWIPRWLAWRRRRLARRRLQALWRLPSFWRPPLRPFPSPPLLWRLLSLLLVLLPALPDHLHLLRSAPGLRLSSSAPLASPLLLVRRKSHGLKTKRAPRGALFIRD